MSPSSSQRVGRTGVAHDVLVFTRRRRSLYIYREMVHTSPFNIAVTLIVLACTTAIAETPSPKTSGIEGTIVVSPTRPGPIRKGEEQSVAPVGNSKFVVKADDSIVKTFTTDGEGHFQVALPPGHYVISIEGGAPRIGRWSFEADVVAGQMTKVNWTADSGMR
jgi:hypothetical protein